MPHSQIPLIQISNEHLLAPRVLKIHEDITVQYDELYLLRANGEIQNSVASDESGWTDGVALATKNVADEWSDLRITKVQFSILNFLSEAYEPIVAEFNNTNIKRVEIISNIVQTESKVPGIELRRAELVVNAFFDKQYTLEDVLKEFDQLATFLQFPSRTYTTPFRIKLTTTTNSTIRCFLPEESFVKSGFSSEINGAELTTYLRESYLHWADIIAIAPEHKETYGVLFKTRLDNAFRVGSSKFSFSSGNILNAKNSNSSIVFNEMYPLLNIVLRMVIPQQAGSSFETAFDSWLNHRIAQQNVPGIPHIEKIASSIEYVWNQRRNVFDLYTTRANTNQSWLMARETWISEDELAKAIWYLIWNIISVDLLRSQLFYFD